jgi:hypothetical protein
LGCARDRLLALPEGGRIKMEFGVDVLSPGWPPPQCGPFDCAVFSLCSWYFSSPGELRATIRKAKTLAQTICLAEWDLRLADISQIGHYAAALVQGAYSAYHTDSLSNIRTPFSHSDIAAALESEGLKIARSAVLASDGLQDGIWEIGRVLSEEYSGMIASSELIPDGAKLILLSEIERIKEHKRLGRVSPLPTLAIVAER